MGTWYVLALCPVLNTYYVTQFSQKRQEEEAWLLYFIEAQRDKAISLGN